MKTLALNPDVGAGVNIDSIHSFFLDHQPNRIDRDLTGIFAFEDRKPYLLHFPRWTTRREGDVINIPEKLRSAILKWQHTGKGWALIHGRNFPPRANSRKERMPLRLSDERFFFHLGGFGNNALWNAVTRKRRMRGATNFAIYSEWLNCQQHEGIFQERWGQMHELSDGNWRAYSSFIWDDGNITHYNMHSLDYDSDTRNYQVYCTYSDDPKNDGASFLPALKSYPQWDGEGYVHTFPERII